MKENRIMNSEKKETRKPALLILAAGMGSRYGGLKQIAPVGPNGELIIEYSIYDALRTGFEKIVCVIREDIEQSFKEIVGERLPKNIPITYAFQRLDDIPSPYTPPSSRTKQWGTAHAVYAARDALDEPFAAINADDFYGYESYRLMGEFLASNPETPAHYCGVPFILKNTLSPFGGVSRGLCTVDKDMKLVSVTECHGIRREDGKLVRDPGEGPESLTGDELVSMNMWGFNSSIFPLLKEEIEAFLALSSSSPKAEVYIPEVVDTLITRGISSVTAIPSPEQWYGVTYTADKPGVEEGIRRQVSEGRYPLKLWS